MQRSFPKKPAEGEFKPPAAWLLGPQLLAALRSILLFVAHGKKIDARDWMRAEVNHVHGAEGADEFWFDYLSDSGDGQLAMYSIAYLCLSDIDAPAGGLTDTVLRISTGIEPPQGRQRLPRGHFLLVGGDAGYPIANYATLAERFQNPFRWAAKDLGIEDGAERRPLFGLPGNHDYYDALDGFNRQFRKPLYPDGEIDVASSGGSFPLPQLQIPSFERQQCASYLALRLPFDWWLWGLDCQLDHLDIRQQRFFRQLGIPAKLIVATAEPTTVFGRRADPAEKTSRAFHRLSLKRPFLGETLAPGDCRLELSGDTHHYARYWGPSVSSEQKAPSARAYASVVSGLGGAFLHPTHAQADEIEAQCIYPSPSASRAAVATALFDPISIARGGFVWLVGMMVGFVAYLGTVAPDSRAIANAILRHLPGSDPAWQAASGAMNTARRGDFRAIGCILLLLASVGVLALGIAWERARRGRPRDTEVRPAAQRARSIGLFTTASTSLFATALFAVPEEIRPTLLHPVLLLITLVWSVSAILLALRHAAWLGKAARDLRVTRRYYTPTVLLLALAIVAPTVMFARVGRYHSAAMLTLDMLVLATVPGLTIALITFAVLVGAKRHGTRGKVGFAFLGGYHALMQIALPVVAVRVGNLASVAAVLVTSFAFGRLARLLAAGGRRWSLVAAWVAFGISATALALLVPRWIPPTVELSPGMSLIVSCVVVSLFAGFMSCVSLGWYLGVSSTFSGHVNEAGAAARVEQFKQFIRFRLTRETLTGFVIAIDEPKHDGSQLKPRLVDVFTLAGAPSDLSP